MNLGNQVEWALHCMVVLAGMPKDKMLSTKLLAEFHGVPKEYLSKSLQALSQAGLVNTNLGPKGGYTLAKSPDKISFLEIIEAVEGKTKTFNCQEIRKNNPCLPSKKMNSVCSIAAVMYQADEAWREVLREKKLSEVVDQISKVIPVDVADKMQKWFIGQ